MRRILDRAAAFAALLALVCMALAVHLATQSFGAGPIVALVKPFGGALAAAAVRSGS